MTKTQRRLTVATTSVLLLLGCGQGGEETLPDDVTTVTSALTCTTNAGNPIINIENYEGTHGLSRPWVNKYYRAVGKHTPSGCNGAYLGDGYYLSAGTCNYQVGQTIRVGGGNFGIQSVLAQKNETNWNYALLALNGTADLDLNEGVLRVSNVNAVPGEKIGAFPINGGVSRFVGGTVHSNGTNNRFNHRLDTPSAYSRGAPIINEAGYLVGIHTEDTCTSATQHNRAMMVDKIISDSALLAARMRTQPCTGSTTVGSTNWVQQGSGVISVDVNTAACGYNATPIYFTSLGGFAGHKDTNGINAIYNATSTGFRIYLDQPGITPSQANSWQWHVNWQAFKRDWNDDVHLYRCAIHSEGQGSWQVSSTTELWQNFTIPAWCNTVLDRYYFVSLTGTEWHREARGVSAIYNWSNTGFRQYLDRSAGITPAQASTRQWAVDIQVSNRNGSGRLEKIGQTTSAQTWGSTPGGLFMDIPTNTGWSFTPRYFASLVSNRASSSLVRGIGTIHSPTSTGFRVYIMLPPPRPNDTPVTPALANLWWKVQWAARP